MSIILLQIYSVKFVFQTTNGPPRIAFPKKATFIERQPSPVLVRHVFAPQNQQQQQQQQVRILF